VEDIIVKSGEEKTDGQPGVDDPSKINSPKTDAGDKPSFSDDTEVELEIDGKVEKIPLKELKAGHLRQSDYTKKTQALAQEKERLADFEALSNWINDPANKDKAEQVLAILEGKEPPKQSSTVEGLDPDDPKDRIIIDLMKKVDGFTNETKKDRESRALREVTAEIDQTKEKYHLQDGDEELSDIIAIARGKDGKENIVKIADRYFDRLAKRDKTTIKKYLEEKDKDGKRPILPSGNAPAGQTKKLSLGDGSAKKALVESLKAGLSAAND
jgi:hypothetical protein